MLFLALAETPLLAHIHVFAVWTQLLDLKYTSLASQNQIPGDQKLLRLPPPDEKYYLVVFKAQLGEPFLEIWIFFASFFLFFPAKPALKWAKPALKKKKETDQKDKNRHLSAETGT